MSAGNPSPTSAAAHRAFHTLALWMPILALFAGPVHAADAKEEYFERLAKISPRSADAHVQLAEWCKAAGLAEYAVESYRRALAIDPDCAKAREALGFVRYGTEWIPAGEKPRRRPPPTPAPAAPAPVPPPEATPASPSSGPAGSPTASGDAGPGAAAPAAPPRAPEPDPGSSPPEPTPATAAAQKVRPPAGGIGEDPFAKEVERKRAWAKEAGDKIAVSFSTHEDADFLIHTTLPASSRELKTLIANLKSVKKSVSATLGLGATARIWPDKLQFFLLKSAPEFDRFADMVDGLKATSPPEGAYVQGDHAVVLRPDTEILPRHLGSTALRRLNGSNRYVGWWIEAGLAEWLFGQSPAGAAQKSYQNTMVYAADVIKTEGQALKIFNLIESAEPKAKEVEKSRALAMSLVDFLLKTRRKGFSDFIAALKSDKAPEPPESKEEFKAFYLTYISTQEEALKDAFRASTESLDEKWKLYVLYAAEGIRAQEAPKAEAPARKKAKDGR